MSIHFLLSAFPPVLLAKTNFYLDPGSGSILFQILIGGILAIGVFVRMQWQRIRTLFHKILRQDPTTKKSDNE